MSSAVVAEVGLGRCGLGRWNVESVDWALCVGVCVCGRPDVVLVWLVAQRLVTCGWDTEADDVTHLQPLDPITTARDNAT